AAKLARPSGGFEVESDESLLVGQVHVADVDDVDRALAAIDRMHDELIADANAVHPGLLERGGGVREIDAHRLALTDDMQVIAVHLLVDTCDAMGANIVNTVCEAIAPRIAKICGGTVALRILSNLADRSLVTARVRYRVDDLATPEADGAKTRDAIILAGDIALADPYRAATHNKGVMNGIDPLAIATGNDWRAIEAGAHAFAASTGRYQPLTSWRAGSNGDLLGKIRLPLKVGIVGGTIAANPAATMGLEIAGVESARELASLMAAVGLAQNFAALRALATTGIQEGHMRLHARSVAAAARVPDGQFDDVVTRLVADGEIKARKAREILEEMRESSRQGEPVATAAGKVILLGEHAVIYGRHALALPIADAVSAEVEKTDAGVTLSVLEWGISRQVGLDDQNAQGIDAAVALILRELGIDRQGFAIRVRSKL
ncbi:MAG: hydroxymethylglutaryl-CoA reductase, degradative, partial [Proteobacteria bacterium]|nr:hydroxymethylglutaryl-CoA reductase, degradative [Pseudomonadota bacterium]